MSRKRTLLRPLSISGLLLLAATASLSLEGPPPPSDTGKPASSAPSPAEMGSRVFRDPETGRFISRPTPDQLEALGQGLGARRARPSAWTLRSFHLPGGGQGVFLDGWADHSLSVRRAETGELRFVCVHGDEQTAVSHELEEAGR